MTTYASHAARGAAHALYDDIARRSSDLGERLALLSEHAKLGALPADVEAVRQRLWAEFDPGPPGPGGQASMCS
jgi:hypothetical protein